MDELGKVDTNVACIEVFVVQASCDAIIEYLAYVRDGGRRYIIIATAKWLDQGAGSI